MTNEQAIKILDELARSCGYEVDINSKDVEALNNAINVLKNERPHGEWISLNPEARGYAEFFKCSNCFERVHTSYFMRECEFDYCPNCGAEMEAEK